MHHHRTGISMWHGERCADWPVVYLESNGTCQESTHDVTVPCIIARRHPYATGETSNSMLCLQRSLVIFGPGTSLSH